MFKEKILSDDEVPAETRQLAAIAYGEGSTLDNENEMYAIASVMVRQRDARGYKDIQSFVKKDKTFSFVVRDGSQRYRKLMRASKKEIDSSPGMSIALAAAQNALQGGEDRSNRAFFWDGLDIKTNYENHEKVLCGIKFNDPSHNIYELKESKKIAILYKEIIKKNKRTGVETIVKEERGRTDHVYESTAAHGGTIFWKISAEYLRLSRGKEYK